MYTKDYIIYSPKLHNSNNKSIKTNDLLGDFTY